MEHRNTGSTCAEAVQDYAVEELRGLIRFIEEQTGETFDWDAFFREVRRARPLDAAVAHRGRAGLFLLVSAHHDAVDAAVGVEKMRVHAAGEVVKNMR